MDSIGESLLADVDVVTYETLSGERLEKGALVSFSKLDGANTNCFLALNYPIGDLSFFPSHMYTQVHDNRWQLSGSSISLWQFVVIIDQNTNPQSVLLPTK